MADIQLLDKSVYELIAAGEVIERPSSVMKELLENAVDSGANRITAEIRNGGVTYMRVTDNGCGIASDQVPTAFLRHATSKLRKAEDLEKIVTMGFRGEALASVAAVARVQLLTKRREDKLGTSYLISGGTEEEFEPEGCPDGTTIIIRDLFYNTPARLKFLKKDVSEGNFVQSVVDKLAVSHPEISFILIRDGKQVRATSGDGKLYSAVYAVYGKQFAASLTPVNFSQGSIDVEGYVSVPHFCRGSRSMQYFYVNNRTVKNLTCMAALEEGYRNCAMTGKFPACVLKISLPPADMDVNVSPSKTEVRFTNEKAVFDVVYLAVKNAILNAENSKEISLSDVKKNAGEENSPLSEAASESVDVSTKLPDISFPEKTQEQERKGEEQEEEEEPMVRRPAPSTAFKNSKAAGLTFNSGRTEYKQSPKNPPEPPSSSQEPLSEINKPSSHLEKYSYINSASLIPHEPESEKKEKDEKEKKDEKRDATNLFQPPQEKPKLRYIGQLFETYILCECGDLLVMMDKHAAHERLNFEELKKTFTSHAQLLMEEEEVCLSAEEWNALNDNLPLLSEIGVELIMKEGFKAQIISLPSIIKDRSPSEIVQTLAQLLIKNDMNLSGELFDDILHTFACKSAIKAHTLSTDSELKALAERIWEDESIRYCPHGRPIITTISKNNIEKNFKRIV